MAQSFGFQLLRTGVISSNLTILIAICFNVAEIKFRLVLHLYYID